MPNCGCFHKIEISVVGPNDYKIQPKIEGQINFEAVLGKAGLSQSISAQHNIFSTSYTVHGVRDGAALRALLNALRGTIFVDLKPDLDECYALGPYTVFDDDNVPHRTVIGDLLHQAKYQRASNAVTSLGEMLGKFILSHPTLKDVDYLVAPPESESTILNVARLWSSSTAKMLGTRTLDVVKIRKTPPQKDASADETEEDAVARLADSVKCGPVNPGSSVLIIDDTINQGATLRVLGKALRASGATAVYGLTAAKDARGTKGGVSLLKGDWE